jgi:hypothetical protein
LAHRNVELRHPWYAMQCPGGQHWCCASSLDGSSLGTLIPGVDHLAGGPYDAGGDPAVAFDSQGHVYYAGLGFDRTAPPNTVAVNKGTFDGSGHLTWSQPTFINPTTAPSTLNDEEWVAADANPSSPFRDRVYVTWTLHLQPCEWPLCRVSHRLCVLERWWQNL